MKVVSDILLQQVQNLSKTDRNYSTNLELVGGNLDKVKFVRGANYLNQMSAIVKQQDNDIGRKQMKLDCKQR